MATQNTKKEAARVSEGLVKLVQDTSPVAKCLDTDSVRGLLLMALQTVSVKRSILQAVGVTDISEDKLNEPLTLPAKKATRRRKQNVAANAAANAAAAAEPGNDDEEEEDDDNDGE
jgi:hypothetical protein